MQFLSDGQLVERSTCSTLNPSKSLSQNLHKILTLNSRFHIMPSGLNSIPLFWDSLTSWSSETIFLISCYIFHYTNPFLFFLIVFYVQRLDLKQSEIVFFVSKLGLKTEFEADASEVLKTVMVFNNLDSNWWYIKSFSSTTIIEFSDWMVKGVSGGKSSGCIWDVWMRYFLQTLRGLLEYCSMKL